MRKLKRSTKQYITVALISIIIVGGAALFAYIITTSRMKETYETKLTLANQEMDENKRDVYIATEDIMAGSIITKDNTEYRNTYATQGQETYIESSDIGKTALVDIVTGTQIIKSIITDANVSSDIRETTYSVITTSSNVMQNDTVDIRVLYPNGENYIVLSKKKIMKTDSESTLEDTNEIVSGENYLWLTEEEILRMSSAIVDAYLYEGTQIYTTEYIEPNLQEASVVNYTPSLATLTLIENDPNIIEKASEYLSRIVRKELENRLASSQNTEVTEIEWDIQNNLTENPENSEKNVVQNEVTTENEKEQTEMQKENYYFEEEEEEKESDIEYGE